MTEISLIYEGAMAAYNSDLADANADFIRAEANGDLAGQVEASQRMADVRVRAQEFERMAQDHVRANTPAPRRELTIEEVLAKPMHAMTQQDMLRVLNNGSKYCQESPLTPDDPYVRAGAAWANATRQGR